MSNLSIYQESFNLESTLKPVQFVQFDETRAYYLKRSYQDFNLATAERSEVAFLKLGGIGGVLAGILIVAGFGLIVLSVGNFGFALVTEAILPLLAQSKTLFLAALAPIAVAFLLMIALYMALYRVLRGDAPGFALLGVMLGVLSTTGNAMSTSSRFLFLVKLAETYITAPEADRRLLVMLGDSNRALIDAIWNPILSFFGAVGLVVIGIAMMHSTRFGRGYGWISVAFGIIEIVSLIIPAPVGIVLTIAWLVLMGQKVYRLSTSQQ